MMSGYALGIVFLCSLVVMSAIVRRIRKEEA